MSGFPTRPLLPLFVLAVVAVAAHADDPPTIGCDQADDRVKLTASARLDPSCTWTRGVEIHSSDVTLDCQGAQITGDGNIGIEISAPTDTALAHVTVRNCHVEGFLNNFRVTRDGFRDLAPGLEYDNAFSDITIADSTSLDSRGVGVYVDGYVTGVTVHNLHIEGAGSTGVYLETGSRGSIVEQSEIVNNGFHENGPDGQFFDVGGISVFFWGTGREGLALDGARDSVIRNNVFSGNSAGAIFLYKNCGEFVHQKPDRWFDRRYGADGNTIEGNTITGGLNGVWIGARMGENTLPMDCSDPAYVSTGAERVVLDYARDDVVRGNLFQNVIYAIRVEDDRATIDGNHIEGTEPAQQAVVVGTRYRTPVLGRPVDGTVITGNRTAIAGNDSPYRWIYGETDTTFDDNQSHGRPVGFCEGVPLPTHPFVFVIAFQIADPDDPPTGGPPPQDPPQPMPPCGTSCTTGAPVRAPRLLLRRLDTPAGDDLLTFKGDVAVPEPFVPALDPVASGIALVLTDAVGARVLDVTIPAGPFDPTTGRGWTTDPRRTTWRWVDHSPGPPGGIVAITVRDLSGRTPGLVRFAVAGRRGDYAVAATPVSAAIILDPPMAVTGQCGTAAFATPPHTCARRGGTLACR